MMWDKLCEEFVIMTSLSYAGIFLKQLIQFRSNNATNVHHLTSHMQHAVLPYNSHADRITSR